VTEFCTLHVVSRRLPLYQIYILVSVLTVVTNQYQYIRLLSEELIERLYKEQHQLNC